MVMYSFLEINGYRLEAPETESVGIMLESAAGEVDEKSLSGWIDKYSALVVK